MTTQIKRLGIIAGIAAIILLGLGYIIGKSSARSHGEQSEDVAKTTMYTCSMHPSVRSADPSKKCPICFMDLIPLVEDEMASHPSGLKVSEAAQKLAQIEMTEAIRRYVTKEVRLVGRVEYDETRLATITSWVAGRLDRLYVDYTGIMVNKGDHMVYIYSPEISSAQQELIEAKSAYEQVKKSNLENVVNAARQTLEASREKLRLWGLSQEQVDGIESAKKAMDYITINAPVGGIVIKKSATEGEYVKTGTPIYSIADLSQVWVIMDAYESDLPWLRYGQEVEFTAEAIPGLTLKGRISFISPTLDRTSRTVKIRVNVPNDGSLKPGMFVRATVKSRLAEGGNVFDDSLAGKWISPMHPEVIKDEPGPCDVCGMPLVKAETLGFISKSDTTAKPPLVVPGTAPLMTGRRAVVYVQNPENPEQFFGRTVTLGPRAGDYIVVDEGLKPGDLVVVNGNFKIDSELQIQAKSSMMNSPYVFDVPNEFRSHLKDVVASYFAIQKALSEDNLKDAVKATDPLLTALRHVNDDSLRALPGKEWLTLRTSIRDTARLIEKSSDINEVRKQFHELSNAIIKLGKSFGTGLDAASYIHHCPMAFNDTGASWLQNSDDPFNPYFGAEMLKCASLKGKIPGISAPSQDKEEVAEKAPNVEKSPLESLFLVYMTMQKALSKDNLDDAKAAAGEFFSDLDDIDIKAEGWAKQKSELAQSAKAVFAADTIEAAREAFAPLSESLAIALPKYAEAFNTPVYAVRCPMAFNNRGATWLQNHKAVENPYFGAAMFACGSVVDQVLNTEKKMQIQDHHDH